MTKKNQLFLGLCIAFCMLPLISSAQTIDSMIIDGEQYYVYPFRKDVRVHSSYASVLKGTKDYSKKMEALYKRLKKGDQTVTLEELEYMAVLDEWAGRSRYNYYPRKLEKAIRANPYPMLIQKYSLDEDIIPVLDPIPDGNYVQFFDDFCLTDEKGKCQMETNRIAGKFSMKNNLLQGEAMWFNLQGDTLKHGYFENGLREGLWKIELHSIEYNLSKSDKYSYIKLGKPDIDTTIEYMTFSKGAKNGYFKRYFMSDYPTIEGYYTNGEPSGEWIERDIQYKYSYIGGYSQIRDRHNKTITKRETIASKSDTLIVSHPWIRKGLINCSSEGTGEYDFYAEYSLISPPKDLFNVAFEQEENLNLEEEDFDSYLLEDDSYLYEDMYYSDYYYDYDYGPYIYVSDPVTFKRIKRGLAIDSLGMTANYSGIMEGRYFNGQIAYSFEFKDGRLVKEDTVFWSNGVAHDVITKVTDSNYYLRSIYDTEGKLYQSLLYDSLGDFHSYQFRYDPSRFVVIDGLQVPESNYGTTFTYSVWDTLETNLTDSLVVFATWYKSDLSRIIRNVYSPNDRTLTSHFYAAKGNVYENRSYEFSEDFDSWTGKVDRSYEGFRMEETRSGSIQESYEMDTLEILQMKYAESRYEIAGDYMLYRDGVPYTGAVNIDIKGKKSKIGNKGFDVTVAARNYSGLSQRLEKKRSNQIYRSRDKGKPMTLPELAMITRTETNSNLGQKFCKEFLPENVLEQIGGIETGYYSYGYNTTFGAGRIEGYMLDGKPHGLWTFYNVNGQIRRQVEYVHGETNGTYKEYKYQSDFVYSRSIQLDELLNDSLPEKPVWYLAVEAEYKNDQLDGNYKEYNWLGEVLVDQEYKDGYLNGPSLDRNNLVCTRSFYKNGYLDGYYQTYLTLPDRDSILLYNLNFQEGNLQGESQTYHVNGELAKRGFFLAGEPIEDYEAFDTLGFKYHYVKFQYSFPVEEKLWEENQLSVRYLFDWEDSIRFIPKGITQTETLDRLVASLGLIDDYLARPYYGRSTLVEKAFVKCHMTKYYPNDSISRDGDLEQGRKVGLWKYYDYNGEFLYQVDYFDTVLVLNDSIRFKSKGLYTELSAEGDTLYKAHVIEKFEKYDCSHTDHYEIRQLYTIWQAHDSIGRMNGFVRNFYDNGVLQSEGELKDGLPTGVWRIYDPFGKLNQYGYYVQGKRDGRWLSGDLSKTKYLGDICLNPNLPDLEEEIKYRENLLDIVITNYKLGKSLNRQFYDVNMNQFREVEEEAVIAD